MNLNEIKSQQNSLRKDIINVTIRIYDLTKLILNYIKPD